MIRRGLLVDRIQDSAVRMWSSYSYSYSGCPEGCVCGLKILLVLLLHGYKKELVCDPTVIPICEPMILSIAEDDCSAFLVSVLQAVTNTPLPGWDRVLYPFLFLGVRGDIYILCHQ